MTLASKYKAGSQFLLRNSHVSIKGWPLVHDWNRCSLYSLSIAQALLGSRCVPIGLQSSIGTCLDRRTN